MNQKEDMYVYNKGDHLMCLIFETWRGIETNIFQFEINGILFSTAFAFIGKLLRSLTYI